MDHKISFDVKYKEIQSLRNQYLNLVRNIVKKQKTTPTEIRFENYLEYYSINNKIYELQKDISNLTRTLNIKTQDKTDNNNNNNDDNMFNLDNIEDIENLEDIEDKKMMKTMATFMPLMIKYYNSLI